MKLRTTTGMFWLALLVLPAGYSQPVPEDYHTADFRLNQAQVRYLPKWDMLEFSIKVKGRAGGTVPIPAGQVDGAPVLGYVFPTTLHPRDVGFLVDEGLVALALTSHPDFDDTPLWDEDNNGNYADDGIEWHTHWVVLAEDDRVPGGLAVVGITPEQVATVLPPTNPGMPMLMDSPGFGHVLKGKNLRVLVPAQRVNHHICFNYDVVTAFMQVSLSEELPMLGVYAVYDILSEDLSLPFRVER